MIPKFIQRRSWTARMLDSRSRIMSPFYAWKVTRANGDQHVMSVRLKGIGSIYLRACENDLAVVEEILLKRVYDGVVSAIHPNATAR